VVVLTKYMGCIYLDRGGGRVVVYIALHGITLRGIGTGIGIWHRAW
jgi:hypothetical protein